MNSLDITRVNEGELARRASSICSQVPALGPAFLGDIQRAEKCKYYLKGITLLPSKVLKKLRAQMRAQGNLNFLTYER